MNRFLFLTDLMTLVKTCLSDDCDYEYVVARALTPADGCHSISLNWVGSSTTLFSDCLSGDNGWGCGGNTVEHTIRLALTRYCPGPDANPNGFDYAAEEREAECFYRDVDLLESCIDCGDYSNLLNNHTMISLIRSSTRFDDEVMGGYATAYIDLTVIGEACC